MNIHIYESHIFYTVPDICIIGGVSILHICIHTLHRYTAHVVLISNNTRDLDNANLLKILQAFGSQKVVMDKLS